MTSHGQQASLPWQRRCAESGGDCVTQYERCAADTAVLDRRPAVRGSQHGCHAIAERDERSSDSSPEFGRWRDRSHAANGPYSFRHLHGTRSSAHELSSRGAAVDNVRELAGDVCGRAVNRHLRVNGLSHAAVDIHRPHSNLAVTAGSAALSDVSSTDHHQQHHAWGRATSLSAGSVDSCAQRPLVKFYSLPDLQVIDGQRRRRRTSTGGSDVTEDRCADSSAVFGFESSMCRQSTFVSMPCISSSSSSQHHQRHQRGAGRRLTPKRFLPTLSISAEVSRDECSVSLLTRCIVVLGASNLQHRLGVISGTASLCPAPYSGGIKRLWPSSVCLSVPCLTLTGRLHGTIVGPTGRSDWSVRPVG